MDKIVKYVIVKNKLVAHETYLLTLKGPTNWIKAGKFFMLKIPGFYLRRPMAPAFHDGKQFSFLYQIMGNGTNKLAKLTPGAKLDALIDLGNGYQYDKRQGVPLLVAGGAGINPILCLANELDHQKIKYQMIVGFKDKALVPDKSVLKKLNKHTIICTDDGSYGVKGTVVDVINKHQWQNLYYFTCGSINMMKAVFNNNQEGQLSLDERMGCGFGACMGCAIKTKIGTQRICKNGPVFESEDLLW